MSELAEMGRPGPIRLENACCLGENQAMIRRRYRCPQCSGEFAYDHHPSVEADPVQFCPRCGFNQEMDPALVAPHIGRPIRATVDKLNRAMEDGSQFRAQIAQEQLGLSAEEARVMTQTNMMDHLREGDTTHVPVDNAVSRVIAAHPQAYGFSGNPAAGAALSPHVQGGPYPNAGLRALQEVREVHPRLVASTGHKAPVSTTVAAEYPVGYRPRI